MHDTGETAKRPQQAIAISVSSMLVLVFVAVAITAYSTSLLQGLKTDESKEAFGLDRLELIKLWLKGFCYGGVSGASWMMMMIRRRGIMFVAQAMVALAGAICLHQLSIHSLDRHLANTLGLVAFQTLGFQFFPPITWHWGSRKPQTLERAGPSEPNQPRQFSIFDIIACTVAAAALFTLMQRVELGQVVEPSAHLYWIVLLWVWIIMPLVAYCCFSMVRPQTGLGKRVSWFVLGLIASTIITILVSLSETGLNFDPPGFDLKIAMMQYARIMGGYMVVLMIFTLAASLGKPVAIS